MAFTVEDFRDLVSLLEQRPEWRAEVRRLVLSEELLSLPAVVRELAAAQRRTEERVEELAAAQRRTEERVEELAAAQRRTEEEIARLNSSLASLEYSLRAEIKKLEDKVDDLRGFRREMEFRTKAPGFLGRVLKRARALTDDELGSLLADALERGIIDPDDHEQVLRADAVVRGRRIETGEEVWLVAEVSATVDVEDVERALDRAGRLGKIVSAVFPAVAGERFTAAALRMAEDRGVVRMTDGRLAWPWTPPADSGDGPSPPETA